MAFFMQPNPAALALAEERLRFLFSTLQRWKSCLNRIQSSPSSVTTTASDIYPFVVDGIPSQVKEDGEFVGLILRGWTNDLYSKSWSTPSFGRGQRKR
mmetsp:Transcript_30229/g.54697  ORF Transcript_30229/g.54697 Transcript_30229/m.54697 type:complete len:98 (+) Transcript_30229:729-1022(+)